MKLSTQFLMSIGFEVVPSRSSDREIVIMCPQCGDTTGNRSINVKTLKTNCWRCGTGGHFIPWAKRMGCAINEDEFSVRSSLTLEEMFNLKPEVRSVLPVVTESKLPKGFTRCKDAMGSVYTRLIGRMAERKNLVLQDLVDADVGFTREDHRWEPFAIFPVYEYGKAVYYQGRTYTDEPGSKTKKFPSNSEVHYGAKYWVYGIDELRKQRGKRVIVMESILNVLSFRWYLKELGVSDVIPVAVFKHAVSFEQLLKLSRMDHIEEVCLLFDHDAIKESWRNARQFTNRFHISVAEMPEGENNKKLDPNDNVALAWDVFNKRKPYTLLGEIRTQHRFEEEKYISARGGLSGFRFQ